MSQLILETDHITVSIIFNGLDWTILPLSFYQNKAARNMASPLPSNNNNNQVLIQLDDFIPPSPTPASPPTTITTDNNDSPVDNETPNALDKDRLDLMSRTSCHFLKLYIYLYLLYPDSIPLNTQLLLSNSLNHSINNKVQQNTDNNHDIKLFEWYQLTPGSMEESFNGESILSLLRAVGTTDPSRSFMDVALNILNEIVQQVQLRLPFVAVTVVREVRNVMFFSIQGSPYEGMYLLSIHIAPIQFETRTQLVKCFWLSLDRAHFLISYIPLLSITI